MGNFNEVMKANISNQIIDALEKLAEGINRANPYAELTTPDEVLSLLSGVLLSDEDASEIAFRMK